MEEKSNLNDICIFIKFNAVDQPKTGDEVSLVFFFIEFYANQ